MFGVMCDVFVCVRACVFCLRAVLSANAEAYLGWSWPRFLAVAYRVL